MAADAPTPPADETPRERAKRATDDQYAHARASAVPNAGKDLSGSARHKANAWKGLADAEATGKAQQLVTREKLLKAEPIDLHGAVEAGHAEPALAAHLAMAKFPAKPDASKFMYRTTPPEERERLEKKARELYYDEFAAAKTKLEELAHTNSNAYNLAGHMRTFLGNRIAALRGYHHQDDQITQLKAGKAFYDHPDHPAKSPVINGLIQMRDRLASSRRGANDVLKQVEDFHDRFKQAHGPESVKGAWTSGYTPHADHADAHAQHVQDVLEGSSYNETFGTKGGGPSRFNPTTAYLGNVTRKGGKVIDAATVKAGTDYLLKTAGMEGVQFGNYVNDDERRHHLKHTAEAFSDLTDVLGLPEHAASLGGKLGIGIGARGHGNAAAHYEPDQKVINLTRASGAGSLAHEWGHFFDHMAGGFGMQMSNKGQEGVYGSDEVRRGKSAIRPEYRAGYEGLQKAMGDFKARIPSVIRAMKKKGIAVNEEYYRSDPEVFARSFERYVQDKLHAAGRDNTYLTGFDKDKQAAGTHDHHQLWPTPDEVTAMAPHFDALMKAYADHQAA